MDTFIKSHNLHSIVFGIRKLYATGTQCQNVKSIANLREQYVSDPLRIQDNVSSSYFKNHTSSSELSEGEGEESVEFSAVLVRSTSSMWSVGKKQHFLTTIFLNKPHYTKSTSTPTVRKWKNVPLTHEKNPIIYAMQCLILGDLKPYNPQCHWDMHSHGNGQQVLQSEWNV
jgi:hypothetical protein